MIKDFLKGDLKVPSLCFHTINECGSRFIIYGGLNANEAICGDLYFLKMDGKTISCASYEKNKTSKFIPLKFSVSCSKILT